MIVLVLVLYDTICSTTCLLLPLPSTTTTITTIIAIRTTYYQAALYICIILYDTFNTIIPIVSNIPRPRHMTNSNFCITYYFYVHTSARSQVQYHVSCIMYHVSWSCSCSTIITTKLCYIHHFFFFSTMYSLPRPLSFLHTLLVLLGLRTTIIVGVW